MIAVAESVDGSFSNAVLPDGDRDADCYRNFTMGVTNSIGGQAFITFPVQVIQCKPNVLSRFAQA